MQSWLPTRTSGVEKKQKKVGLTSLTIGRQGLVFFAFGYERLGAWERA